MYKITFQLRTPVCFIDKPVFDSIIAYAHMREKLGKDFAQKLNLNPDEKPQLEEIPLKMHPDGYLMASYMFWDPNKEVEFTGSWKKRWDARNDDLADFGRKKRQVRVNAGPYKSYDMPMNLHHIPEVWFYFDTDDVNEVERLVTKWIFGLGKKRSQGYGEISDFNIQKTQVNLEEQGYRPIPVSEERFFELMKEGDANITVSYTGYRPPYWLPENQTYCIT